MVPILDQLNNQWNAANVPWIQWHYEVADYPDDQVEIDYEPSHDLEAGIDTTKLTVNWITEHKVDNDMKEFSFIDWPKEVDPNINKEK